MQLAWQADFSSQANIPFFCALSSPTDRTVFQEYKQWTRYTPPGQQYAHTPYGKPAPMWIDQNHSQAELLYLLGILFAQKAGEAAHPSKIPQINLRGARFEMELLANNMWLDGHVQLSLLGQWKIDNPRGGRGNYVNYLVTPIDGISIDEQMGWTPVHERSGPQSVSAQWRPVSIQIEMDDPETPYDEETDSLLPIDGRPDKIHYGRARHISQVWAGELQDLMIVANCGPVRATVEPMARLDGGWGELYCRKFEIWTPDPVVCG